MYTGLIIADAPARSDIQNIQNHNGTMPCNICEINTILSSLFESRNFVPQSENPNQKNPKKVRVYPYQQSYKLRSQQAMTKQAESAVKNNFARVCGVKGPSIVNIIPAIDISTCMGPEL